MIRMLRRGFQVQGTKAFRCYLTWQAGTWFTFFPEETVDIAHAPPRLVVTSVDRRLKIITVSQP